MFETCSALCMYDYTAMCNSNLDPGCYADGIGPRKYFLWNYAFKCWRYLNGDSSTCFPANSERMAVVAQYNAIPTTPCPTMFPSSASTPGGSSDDEATTTTAPETTGATTTAPGTTGATTAAPGTTGATTAGTTGATTAGTGASGYGSGYGESCTECTPSG